MEWPTIFWLVKDAVEMNSARWAVDDGIGFFAVESCQ